MIALRLFGVALLTPALAARGTASNLSPTTASSSALSEPTVATPAASFPRRICAVVQDGGTFYLAVTSATAGNYADCQGQPDAYGNSIDELLDAPGMDLRCRVEIDGSDAALIGVYSADRKRADLAAARVYCAEHQGSAP